MSNVLLLFLVALYFFLGIPVLSWAKDWWAREFRKFRQHMGESSNGGGEGKR